MLTSALTTSHLTITMLTITMMDSMDNINTNNSKPFMACLVVKTKTEPTPRQRELGCDAFSYYSNKFNLMKTLLLKDDDVQVLHSTDITFQGPAAKRRKGANAQPIQVQDGGVRQTRLSFEVHPSLLLEENEDFLGVLDDMNCADVSDYETEDDETEEEEEEEDEEESDDKDSGGTAVDEEKDGGEDDDYDCKKIGLALRSLFFG
jgi:hypothetical protein